MSLIEDLEAIENFKGRSLAASISELEDKICGLTCLEVAELCIARRIDHSLLDSIRGVKKAAAQIDVVFHSIGIVKSLEGLLGENETVESLSLGAGNTGRKFDLETNLRVAEFKFIDWQGGSETIRQNSIFKDFFELAESDVKKLKYLYVIGVERPLKFLNGKRALNSVLSKQPDIARILAEKYGADVTRVYQYFQLKRDEVQIVDIRSLIERKYQNPE